MIPYVPYAATAQNKLLQSDYIWNTCGIAVAMELFHIQSTTEKHYVWLGM